MGRKVRRVRKDPEIAIAQSDIANRMEKDPGFKGMIEFWINARVGAQIGRCHVANPKRLIDVETLKQGAALLEKKVGAPVQEEWANRLEWQRWANRHAIEIMEALTAFAALEAILDHTHITELIWWGDPGVWGLRTDTDQTGEGEGNWTDPTLTGVLRAAAADFAWADELEDAERDRELAFEADAPPEVARG